MGAAPAIQNDDLQSARVRIKASSAIYADIVDFLNDEAALMDDDLHKEWLGCLAEDISYVIPLRKNLHRKDGRGFDGGGFLFKDDLASLTLRVRRSVEITHAYDREPPPRIRRFITNIIVHEGDASSEYAVRSNILLMRNRFNDAQYDMLTGKREDVVRQVDGGLKLAKRIVYVDQTVLGAPYLNVFM